MAFIRKRIVPKLITVISLSALIACEASFIDQRPQSQSDAAIDSSSQHDSAITPSDTIIPSDSNSATDTSALDQTIPDTAVVTDQTLGTGTFSGVGGHSVSGSASLVKLKNGTVEVRLNSNFVSQSGPDLYVVLSSRSTIGPNYNSATDIELGTLKANSGEQSYKVPNNDTNKRYVIVWCKSFGVDFGVAHAE